MTKEEVLFLIEILSESQEFYNRLLYAISSCPQDIQDEFFQRFEDCKSPAELISKLEN